MLTILGFGMIGVITLAFTVLILREDWLRSKGM